MGMTKGDYEDLGEKHAEVADKARFSRTDSSWQAVSYFKGWDRIQARKKSATATKIRPRGKSVMSEVVRLMGVPVSPPPGGVNAKIIGVDETTNLRTDVHDAVVPAPPLNNALVGMKRGDLFIISGGTRPGVINMERMAANTRDWPAGAAEHARLLAEGINKEANPIRRERLTLALNRLQQRHQPKDPK